MSDCAPEEDLYKGTLIDTVAVKVLARVHLILGVLLLCLVASMLAHPASKLACSDRGRRHLCWRECQKFTARASKWLGGMVVGQPSQEDIKIEELAGQRLVEYWHRTFRWSVAVFCIILSPGLVAWYRAWGVARMLYGGLKAADASDVLASQGFCASVYGLASCLLFLGSPRLLTKRNIYIWIFVTYVRNALMLFVPMSSKEFEVYLHIMTVIKLTITIHCSNMSFVFWLNLGYATVTTHASNGKDADAGSCDLHMNFVREAAGFVFVMLAYYVQWQMTQREISGALAVKASHNVEASIEKLLYGMCDAVVHLRRDLTLKKHCQQLDALLVRGSTASQTSVLRGPQSFLDLLHQDSDKDKCCACFRPEEVAQEAEASGDATSALPSTVHVVMRDSFQMPVPVQLYFAKYMDAMNDELFHIVGIRESCDWEDAGVMHGSANSLANMDQDWVEASRQMQQARASPSIDERTCSTTSNAEVIPLALPMEYEYDDVTVWINPFLDGMPMVKCTPAFFTYFGGPSLKRSTCLMSWVPRRDRKLITRRIQTAVNELLWEPFSCVKWQVALQPRHLALHQVSMSMVLLGLEDASGDELVRDPSHDSTHESILSPGGQQARPAGGDGRGDGGRGVGEPAAPARTAGSRGNSGEVVDVTTVKIRCCDIQFRRKKNSPKGLLKKGAAARSGLPAQVSL